MCNQAKAVRQLNDKFRTTLVGGRIIVTAGLADRQDLQAIIAQVQSYNTFNPGNDPYEEHDFGAFDRGDDKIFWKIDYYGRDLASGSENPADPKLTTRVLTVMLAKEY
jgi:hypothetical protein